MGHLQFVFKVQYFFSITAGIYRLKINNRNSRTRREICSKLTIKTPERRHSRRSTYSTPSSKVSIFIVNFEQVNAGWDLLHSQNDTGDKTFSEGSIKGGSIPKKFFYSYINQVFNLQCRPYLNQILPLQFSFKFSFDFLFLCLLLVYDLLHLR